MRKSVAIGILSLMLMGCVLYSPSSANPNAWFVPDGMWIKINSDVDCVKNTKVTMSGGFLNLSATSGSISCGGGRNYGPQTQTYSSGHVFWQSFNFSTGHLEVRATLADHTAHPTLWLMGSQGQANNPYSYASWDNGLWPVTDNEIDFAESFSQPNNTTITQSIHIGSNQSFNTTLSDITANFHIYGVDIAGDGTARFCVDGVQSGITTAVLTSTSYYMLASIEVTGSPANTSMQLDYVRLSASTGNCTTLSSGSVFDDEFTGPFGGSSSSGSGGVAGSGAVN